MAQQELRPPTISSRSQPNKARRARLLPRHERALACFTKGTQDRMTTKLSFAPLTNVKQANARAWLSRSFALLGSPLFAGLYSFSRPMPVRGSAGASPSLVLRCSRGFIPSLGQCPCLDQQELRPPSLYSRPQPMPIRDSIATSRLRCLRFP